MSELKPCPFCGSTDLKHYVTSARGGRYRGVIVCQKCGVRKESYSDWTHSVTDAYCGDWKAAEEFTREQARGLVERDWNHRASECDRDKLIRLADVLRKNGPEADCSVCPLSRFCLSERGITCFECRVTHTADVILEAIGEER